MAKFSRFVMGGLVGAALGLLFAPRSGRELRQKLMGGATAALPPSVGDTAAEPTAAAVSEPETAVELEPEAEGDHTRVAVDLEARLAESRRQVEKELDGIEQVDAEVSEAEPVNEAGPVKTRVDREEMRKRIEETRSRLKAKAFDSMVEGETLIATGEESSPEDAAEAAPGLDQETDEMIDELLGEEE